MYSCAPKGNPNYTFRESIPLGVTAVSAAQFRRSIEGLQDEWQGWTYDLLSRNCNHFCEALVEILGVGPLPAWVNRFAINADYALETSQTALSEVKKIWRTASDSINQANATATGWLKDRIPIPLRREGPDEPSAEPPAEPPAEPSAPDATPPAGSAEAEPLDAGRT